MWHLLSASHTRLPPPSLSQHPTAKFLDESLLFLAAVLKRRHDAWVFGVILHKLLEFVVVSGAFILLPIVARVLGKVLDRGIPLDAILLAELLAIIKGAIHIGDKRV